MKGLNEIVGERSSPPTPPQSRSPNLLVRSAVRPGTGPFLLTGAGDEVGDRDAHLGETVTRRNSSHGSVTPIETRRFIVNSC
jgi:hypothetical protein